MKRIHPLIILSAGLLVGLLCGAGITAARSDPPKFDSEQVVAQSGETKITRGQLAQYALSEVGNSLLTLHVRESTILTEAARKANISVSADEIAQRIDERLKYGSSEEERKQLEAKPRWILEEQLRPVMLLEKLLKLQVNDSEAKNFFTGNPNLFSHPARYHLICTATNSQASAESALQQIKDAKNADEVRAISQDLSADDSLRSAKGDIGWTDSDGMTFREGQAICEGNDGHPLKPGQCTGILYAQANTQTPYQIFYVAEFTPEVHPAFEDVKATAVYYTRAQKDIRRGRLVFPAYPQSRYRLEVLQGCRGPAVGTGDRAAERKRLSNCPGGRRVAIRSEQ